MKFKWNEIRAQSWILLCALVLLATGILLVSRKKQKWSGKALVFASVCIALSFVLSYIRLWKMPQGGSVTPASMLPVMVFSYVFGFVPGLLCGMVYGLLQLIQNPEIFSLAQAILDYPLAFGCLALAGIGPVLIKPDHNTEKSARKEVLSMLIGIAMAAAGRFLCHALSGWVFFADYAAGSGLNPLVYSLAYNSYVLVEGVLCFLVASIPQVGNVLKRLEK